MLTSTQFFFKRLFDFFLALFLLPIFLIPILVLIVLATIDTKQFGVFSQKRVGQNAKLFNIYKIRSLRAANHQLGKFDNYASSFGKFLRNSKLDELPQLFNVLIGDMSFVGPRPDLPGFADELKGDDRIILKLKPGITCEATLKYRNEDDILKQQKNPEEYNRTIIWVDKVKINKNYVANWSFCLDLKLIWKSLFNSK